MIGIYTLIIFVGVQDRQPVLVIAALLVINAYGWFLMFHDKRMSQMQGEWRIPERSLLLTALIGGSIGVFTGMRTHRHKTKHLRFSLGIPFILAIHIFLGVILANRLATGY